MGFVIKAALVLAVIAFLGLIGYSYYPGTLTPTQTEVTKPVTLNVDE